MRIVWTSLRGVAAVLGTLLMLAGVAQSASMYRSAPTGLEVAVGALLVLECWLAGVFFIRMSLRHKAHAETECGDRHGGV